MATISRKTRAYVAFLVVLSAISAIAAYVRFDGPTQAPAVVELAFLALLSLGCGSLLTAAGSSVSVSLGFVTGMASVLLFGPGGAAVVGAVAAVQHHPGGLAPLKRIFNGAQFALAGTVSGLGYQAMGGSRLLHQGQVSELVIATAVIVCLYYVTNTLLVAGVISLAQDVRLSTVFWGAISWSTVSYLAYGLLGLAMAALWQISIVAGLLVLVPIFVARWAFGQYAAEQAAYDSTVAALCQAVETKDHYTRGHSERVSLGSVLIARQLGMREDRVGAIRYAGMLHDVGKLGVPTRVLQKSGQLTQEEFDSIKLHPVRGHEMLRGIDFLSEALAGIIHHHERLDGRGYPMGLKGDDIPEFARIIAVADALDAMTSTRSYRAAKSVEEALSEIRASAGSQFDPAMVDAVELAVARHGWSPQRREDDAEKPVGVASMGEMLLADDHDDRLLEGGRPA